MEAPRTLPPPACPSCRGPIADFNPGANSYCSLLCAVDGDAQIDGLTDCEIVEFYLEELLAGMPPAKGDRDFDHLQAGLVRLAGYFLGHTGHPLDQQLLSAINGWRTGRALGQSQEISHGR